MHLAEATPLSRSHVPTMEIPKHLAQWCREPVMAVVAKGVATVTRDSYWVNWRERNKLVKGGEAWGSSLMAANALIYKQSQRE